MEINVEYIKGQLQRRADQRQLAAVARGAGVNLRTLHRLKDGKPGTIAMADKVQKFLKLTEKQKDIVEN